MKNLAIYLLEKNINFKYENDLIFVSIEDMQLIRTHLQAHSFRFAMRTNDFLIYEQTK